MSEPLVALTSRVPLASGRLAAGIPAPESPERQVAVRAVALLAVLATSLYLVWRTAATLNMSVWWLAVPLLLLEVHALLSLLLFVAPLWDLDAVRPPPPIDGTTSQLAVLIPTYNEPMDILLPTVAAAVSMSLPHQTWVLDDADRAEVAALAESLGAHYLTRADRSHAKAGNINHALAHIDADIVALLDADHVADRNFLRNTLGYFDDPQIALVQTPQDFYNVDSFEHQDRRRHAWWPWRRAASPSMLSMRFSEQELFYRALQPGRNRLDAAFCCGTGAVLRTSALRSVGGLATETVTEDIHTSIRLHRSGWKSRYHNEVLARGLAAADAGQYLVQRVRWGTGAMQVLRRENPAWVSGLSTMQRVSYLGPLLGWFDSWRTLGYLLAPMAVLVTGAVPVRADALTFGLAFGAVFMLQRWALRALSRGMAPQGIATVFELVRLPATLLATTRLVSRRERRFVVTTKGRTGDKRARMRVPRLLTGLLMGTAATAAWFVATALGLTPTSYAVPWVAYAALGWLLVNGALLIVAIRRIRQVRFGAERRASVRFDVSGTAQLGGSTATLLDASLTGALLSVPRSTDVAPVIGEHAVLDVDLGSGRQTFAVLVRSVRQPRPEEALPDTAPDGFVVGLEYAPGQDRKRASLALALFATSPAPHLVGPRPPHPSESAARDYVDAGLTGSAPVAAGAISLATD